MDWIKAIEQFGLIGGLLLIIIAGILAMCGFGFKWILEQFKVELEGNRKERAEYLNILNRLNVQISDHNERNKEDHKAAQEQHSQMIITLGRINGYKN